MALDIAAGVIVLLGVDPGISKGFVAQAIGLAALIGCVYAADPLRDLALPYAQAKFPTIQAPLFAKLLWWTAAVLGFVVMAGLATTIVKLLKTKPYDGEPEGHGRPGGRIRAWRGQGERSSRVPALGAPAHEPAAVKLGPWVEQQIAKSRGLALSRTHQSGRSGSRNAPAGAGVRGSCEIPRILGEAEDRASTARRASRPRADPRPGVRRPRPHPGDAEARPRLSRVPSRGRPDHEGGGLEGRFSLTLLPIPASTSTTSPRTGSERWFGVWIADGTTEQTTLAGHPRPLRRSGSRAVADAERLRQPRRRPGRIGCRCSCTGRTPVLFSNDPVRSVAIDAFNPHTHSCSSFSISPAGRSASRRVCLDSTPRHFF